MIHNFYPLILLFGLSVISCAKEEIDDSLDVICPSTEKLLKSAADSTTECNPPRSYTISHIGLCMTNSIVYDGKHLSAQGMSIHDNTMFRLYDTGICQTFDISNIDMPETICTFELGSHQMNHHSNGCQFSTEYAMNGEYPYLYVAGTGMWCVEEVTESSAILVQKIVLKEPEVQSQDIRLNMIVGDDGFLWACGRSVSRKELLFYKFVKPSISEGDVEITFADAVDSWSEPDFIFEESVSQSGKVHKGFLYYVFGTESTDRHISVYDITTHEKVNVIDLNDSVQEEPEDLDFLRDGSMLLVLNGWYGYYVLKEEMGGETSGINQVKL